MFEIGEYAVCPGHGLAKVTDLQEKELAGELKSFYVLQIVKSSMTVMVPTDSLTGIRELATEDEVEEVYEVLKERDCKLDNSTWNRRYRLYANKIKTGSLVEIAEVLRSLFILKNTKSLSFGEKKMLDQCQDLLGQEMAITSGTSQELVKDKINSCFIQ
jgi:CarD family transcriptional regulator